MNLKTTLVLLVLAAAGGVLFWFGPAAAPLPVATLPVSTAGAGTLAVLEDELTADNLQRIEVRQGDRVVVLQRGPDHAWTMPGKWPTRQPEVKELVDLLTGLRSRFAPESADAEKLKDYGFDQPAVTVVVRAGDKEHRLAFSEKAPPVPEESGEAPNRFSRPTRLRLDDNAEMVRLAPGLVALLDRPLDYYQQRRLFPAERVARDNDPQEKVERLTARAVAVGEKKADGSNYTLNKAGDDWELTAPVHDRVDPEKLKAILTALPDVWAEQFVEKPKPDLDEYGLKDPEQTVRVTLPGGETMVLLVGKLSPTVHERKVTRPSPPGMPVPPVTDTVREEYRYAKLQDNAQIFEIKADKLKELFVPLDTVRDARLARFRTEDATRLEVTQAGQPGIIFVKEKGRWRIEEPLKADAEASKVNELLDKVSALQARDKDVIDKGEPKTYGLDKAGTIKVTVEEEVKGEPTAKDKKKVTKTFTLDLGKEDTEKKKQYVRVEGWDRINAVDTSLAPLVSRPALAYRGRRIFDFSTVDLDTVKVQRGDEALTLKLADGTWKLAEPVAAEADKEKARQLASGLSQMEAVEYVTESAKEEELEPQYGLGKPALSATLTFTEAAKKPAQALLLGKQRGTKPEYFAKLADATSVFVVKKDIRDTLDQGSLAYRPLQFPTLAADEVKELRVQKEGQDEYRLARKDGAWRITAPFDAAAMPAQVQPMVDQLATLKCQRYEAHTAKEEDKYGLEKPYLRLTLATAKKEGDKEEAKERVLLVGKPVEKEPAARYAKLADVEGVFVVGDALVTAVDHGALDLLDRKLLALDREGVDRVRSQSGETKLALAKEKDEWRVVESPAEPFAADKEAVETLLNVGANLRALRYAAYGPKVDLAKYGLDKPEATVTFTVAKPAAEGKKPETTEHTLLLGKPVEGAGGDRYAKLDKGEGVAVLEAGAAKDLTRGYLDYVNRTVLNFDPAAVTTVVRRMGSDELEVTKNDEGWQIVKPAEQKGDEHIVQNLLSQLNLRARRVAAYPAGDLKPFGLDEPAAVVTLKLTADGKMTEHVLKIGKAADEAAGERFALADDSKTVVVLPGSLSKQLVTAPLGFRDRTLARFVDADRAVLEYGQRKAVFTKVDGTWKLTDPLEAEAEHTELENLINAVARLQANELVAEKPGDLKPYGLDKPEVRWHFQSGDKDVLSLALGSREKGRAYGKLEKGDVVFLLDAPLTNRLFAEYRTRAVWNPSLDSAQAEALTLTRGSTSFTLEKTDAGWQLAGKPDVKVKADAVSETLAAVAGLKAERFVVDKGADLKLFGLEPPELTVTVQTRSGPRVLHVGRPEGDSKRYYARVPDKERSDVFVISEADAARIVRDLPAFTAVPTKPDKPAP
jgi:hypothetical protein